jgi:hypothetical protein
MAKTLFVLNEPPYGLERSYNALRLVRSLTRREGEDVKCSSSATRRAARRRIKRCRWGSTTLKCRCEMGPHGVPANL